VGSRHVRAAINVHRETLQRWPDDLLSLKLCQFHQLTVGDFPGCSPRALGIGGSAGQSLRATACSPSRSGRMVCMPRLRDAGREACERGRTHGRAMPSRTALPRRQGRGGAGLDVRSCRRVGGMLLLPVHAQWCTPRSFHLDLDDPEAR
jgi:hypothetical protein